ncbi:unnamed protein product [Mytilus coruscus]|uniref:Protein kinase domain-containing protein n=1 Tax=Mytilus coruscus TaxID=42192 RepID=A0A6J8A286_MYTCO|nr:unnamed protein product [Mytilus coruscus]
MAAFTVTDKYKITVRGKHGKYSFIIEKDFIYDELVQAFPAATALAYSDEISEKIVITASNGIFKTPADGWIKEGRTYFVIEGNTVESDKEQHIKDMITAIREQKKNPKNDFKKVEKKRSDGEENTDINTLERKHDEQYTRSRNPKLHIGWQHYKAGRYKQVFKADGGSVRQLPISTLDLEIDDVILLGTGVFYPDGKSKYGHLKEMKMYLADASGQKLTFERVNETKPNLGNYLRFNGLQLSKCTFYLMTKLRKDQSFISKNEQTGISLHGQSSSCVSIQSDNFITPQQDLVSNKTRSLEQHQAISNQPQRSILLPVDVCGTVKERQEIVIRYYRERLSKYSEETSIISCSSIRQCKDITSFDEPVVVDEVYNPCDNGFSICRMQIGGKDFIDTKFERIDGVLKKTTRYPSAGVNIDGIIIHEALEIWGYDEDNLLIGLVIGTTENVLYTWFNSVMISSGSMNIIVVTEPGIYSCEVSFADIKQLSKAVQIIALSDIDERTSGSITKTISNGCFHPSGYSEDLNIDYSSIEGRGAFGTVYKGKWTGLEVAVKAIPIKKRAKTAMLRTVEKEININSKLRHPNIIQFLAVARVDTTIYLVHKFIMGCNMEDAIFSEETKLDMDIKAMDKPHIMKQVVQAVSYMHSLEPVVLYHDIKPGNILIRKSCLTTKVCDMGISRLTSVGAATTTAVGSTCGSPAYMTPECLLRQENTSPSTDIWSLGVTFIEFFTEKDAWSVDDELDPVAAIKDKMKQEVSPVAQGSDIPENVMVVLKKCVHFDTALRPTANKILHDLY